MDLAFHQRLRSPHLSLRTIARMSEGEAREALINIRWKETLGKPVCPHCGSFENYTVRARPIWVCKPCKRQFSITSSTIFHDRKMPLRDIMLCAALFAGGAKGVAASQIRRYTGSQYKTIWALVHKMREAIQRPEMVLSGAVEIDGCTIGGYRYCEQYNIGTFTKRLYRKKFNNRRVVTIVREKIMPGRLGRTKAFVGKKEMDSREWIKASVASGSVIHADGAHAWDGLRQLYEMLRVDHDKQFKSANGACTNSAESFFGQLRKMQYGVHHHIGAQYLANYANELAWRQDHRHLSEHERILLILDLCFKAPVSQRFSRYWQKGRDMEVQTRRGKSTSSSAPATWLINAEAAE